MPEVAAKFTLVAPAATVTEVAIANAELLSDSVTALPPLGAAFDSVTVHIVLLPDVTVAGEHCSPVSVNVAAGATVTAVVTVLVPNFAVTVTA